MPHDEIQLLRSVLARAYDEAFAFPLEACWSCTGLHRHSHPEEAHHRKPQP